MSKKLFEEQIQEDYQQDLLALQAGEYDRERELLNVFNRTVVKKPFSQKFGFKNRRNHHRFAKKNIFYSHGKLPF